MTTSSDFRPSLAQRAARSSLWSAGFVVLWIAALVATDRCWFYVNGIESISVLAVAGFAWLFLLLVMTWRGRVGLIVLTLLIVAVILPTEINHIAAAESQAASVLRRAAQKLEQDAPTSSYPARVGFDVSFGATRRFYRFEYTPQYSTKDGIIDGFLLKARPQRYDCGCTLSLTLATNGKVYMTQENREATAKDPILE